MVTIASVRGDSEEKNRKKQCISAMGQEGKPKNIETEVPAIFPNTVFPKTTSAHTQVCMMQVLPKLLLSISTTKWKEAQKNTLLEIHCRHLMDYLLKRVLLKSRCVILFFNYWKTQSENSLKQLNHAQWLFFPFFLLFTLWAQCYGFPILSLCSLCRCISGVTMWKHEGCLMTRRIQGRFN